jgi:galactose mutarotase-like enzyme
MIHEIRNRHLAVQVAELGAELQSIRSLEDGTEFLWQGDPAYWAGRAPLLFPVVGALAGGVYRHAGRTYRMPMHGFARRSEFVRTWATGGSLGFRLSDSPETREAYPFRFQLDVEYRLEGASVVLRLSVANRGEEPMPFLIGLHPGFRVPCRPGCRVEDCFLEFERPETLDRWTIDPRTHLLHRTPEPFLRGERRIALVPGLFDRDALIFEGVRSQSVAIGRPDDSRRMIVGIDGFPHLGIWARPGAPFVCIEPWFGTDEPEGFGGELRDRRGAVVLAPGATFGCSSRISVD